MTTLLVASSGGHLRELHLLRPRLEPLDPSVLWVTNDGPQSRALLPGEDVVFVPYLGSRNVTGIARAAVDALVLLRRRRDVTAAVSTGSAIALSFLPLAAARGITGHYIESGTRVTTVSVTGRVLRRTPGVTCYTQHPRPPRPGWHFAGSVLDGFRAVPAAERPLRRVLVTLGTWRQPFRGLVERLVEILPPGVETTWQTGHTDVSGLGLETRPWLSPPELEAALHQADVVVTHAGMGATLDALQAGKVPVVVPRRKDAGEQIDDHQAELATELERLGLAVTAAPTDLTTVHLRRAATQAVELAEPPAFRLSRG